MARLLRETGGRVLREEKPSGRVIREEKPQEPLFPLPEQKTDIGRLLSEFGVGAVESAGLGFPSLIAGGIQPGAREILKTPSEIKAERVARGIGTATGFVAGLPKAVFQTGAKLGGAAAARFLPQAGRFIRGAAKGAGAFGLFEAAQAPERDIREKLTTVPISLGIGAALGFTGEALRPALQRAGKGIKNLVSRIFRRQPTPSQIPRSKALVPVRGKQFILEPTGTGRVIREGENIGVLSQKLTQEQTAQSIREQVGPEFAGNIKLSKFPKRAQETLKKVVQERPDTIVTTKFSDKQLLEKASEIKKTGKFEILEGLFKDPTKEGLLAAEIKAKRELTAEAILRMGDDIEPVLGRIRELSQITKEPGRALRQFRLPVALQQEAVESIEQKIKQTADPAVRAKLVEMKTIFGGKEFNPNIWDKIVEWATAIKLSSPKTPARAIIGNTFNALMKAPERVTTSIVDKMASVISGRSRERFAREALAQVSGGVRSFKEAGRLTVRTLLDEHASLREATRAGEVVFGRGAIKGKFGKFVRLPFRFVAAPDTFIRTIDKGGNIQALATRQAIREGLKGANLANRIQQIVTNPTPELLATAQAEAARTVFQNPLEGFLKKVNNLRIANPGARLVIPFFKTPVNLAKTFLQKTPFTVALPSSRRAIAGLFKEGGGEGARVLGEAITGSGIMAALITYAMEGNITGRGPKGKSKRDALFREGWQPNSVKIGDRYISFNGLEPLSTFLQVAATIVETREEVGTEKAKKIVFDLSKNFAEQPFLTGLNDLMEAFEDERKFDRFLATFVAGNIVPTGVRAIAQAVEPTLRVPKGVPETILSRVPGLTERVLPRRNVFGEEIQIPGSPLIRAISPTRVTKEFITPVDAELRKLGITIGFPSTTAGNLKLTPEEFDEILRISGPKIKKSIGALLTMNEYWELNSDEKIKLIKQIERNERKEIRDEIIVRKVISGINEKGIGFLIDLKKKNKLTEQVEEIGALYLEELGILR